MSIRPGPRIAVGDTARRGRSAVCLKEGTDLPMQAGADAPGPQKRPGGNTPGPVMLCEPISWTTTLPAAPG